MALARSRWGKPADFSARRAGVAQPCRVVVGIDFPGGEGQGLEHGFFLGWMEIIAVRLDKQCGRHQSRALVSVEERVVFHDSKGVCSCEIEKIRRRISHELKGPCERRIEKSFVSDAFKTTKTREQIAVETKDVLPINPYGLFHLANSRKALR